MLVDATAGTVHEVRFDLTVATTSGAAPTPAPRWPLFALGLAVGLGAAAAIAQI